MHQAIKYIFWRKPSNKRHINQVLHAISKEAKSLQLCSEVVILTGGRWRVFIGVHGALGAGRGGAAHSPQLGREGPPPATGLTNRAQQTHQLHRLTPIKRSLAVAAGVTLLAHGGQHLANVGRQQVIHFVALLWRKHLQSNQIFFIKSFMNLIK